MLKNMKFSLGLLVVLSLVFSVSTASAKAVPTKDQVLKDIHELQDEFDFEVTELDKDSEILNKEPLKFDSVEEFEEFLKSFETKSTFDLTKSVSSNISPYSIGIQSYDDIGHIKWWAPFTGWGWTGAACWKNITFNYNYDFKNGNPYFTSIDENSIKSYLSGVTIAISWHQTNADADITTRDNNNDKAEIEVKGYYLLGVDVAGFEIGAKINDTWNGSLTLVSGN